MLEALFCQTPDRDEILLTTELAGSTHIALHDIDEDRLGTSEIVTRKIFENQRCIHTVSENTRF